MIYEVNTNFSIDENTGEIIWNAPKSDYDANLFYTGKKVSNEEFNDLFIKQFAQSNSLSATLNKFFEKFPQILQTQHAAINAAHEQMVQESVAAIVGAAPEQLNTLSELAKALDDDANYAATVTAALADLNAQLTALGINLNTKVSKAGDTITGDLQILGDIILGEGEFSEPGVVDKINGKLKLFAPTGNTTHDYQWSVIDIINPGVGTQQLKMGITGGSNRWGQIEYTFGENAQKHVKLNFREDGLYVVQNDNYSYDVAKKLAVIDDILAKAVSKTGDTITGQLTNAANNAEAVVVARPNSNVRTFYGIAYGSQTVAQIKAVWNDGDSGGLLIKKDGLYQASSSNDNEGVKLATLDDIGGSSGGGSKMYKHTLYFCVNATSDDYPHTSDWEGVYSFTKTIFNDSATPLTYYQAIEFIGNIFTINNLGQLHIDSMRDNYQDVGWQGYYCTRCDSSGYDKVYIMFMRNGYNDTVTEV